MPSILRTVSPSIIVLLIFECYSGIRGSSIRSLDVPLAVRNGTGPVDLICVYEIDEEENGLVIKWFHEAYQIYQWIPPIPPQDIGIIEGIAEYPIENLKDPYSRSMIRLKTVTINMAGEYTCAISTFQDEASNSTKMIVYVPETDMTMHIYPFNKTHVNLRCVVTGARPRPSLKFYIEGIESNGRGNDQGSLTDRYKGDPRTSLDVVIEDTLDPAVVECEMSIPETKYKRRERIVYYPTQLLSYRTNVSQGRHYAMLLVVCALWSFGESVPCDQCGRECANICGTRQFRACCFNNMRKRQSDFFGLKFWMRPRRYALHLYPAYDA